MAVSSTILADQLMVGHPPTAKVDPKRKTTPKLTLDIANSNITLGSAPTVTQGTTSDHPLPYRSKDVCVCVCGGGFNKNQMENGQY